MIQKKWFRIEQGADGSILSCEEVEAKGRRGAFVRFYEALSKTEACSFAKRWWEAEKSARRGRGLRLRSERANAGLCTRCGKTKVKNKPVRIVRGRECATAGAVCDACRARVGTVGNRAPVYASAREAREAHIKRKRQWVRDNPRVTCTLSWARLLRELDELGPVAFRSWLVSKIPATRAQEPGMVGPLRTKKDHIDWFESSLEKSMWHPPMAVDEPMAQAAE